MVGIPSYLHKGTRNHAPVLHIRVNGGLIKDKQLTVIWWVGEICLPGPGGKGWQAAPAYRIQTLPPACTLPPPHLSLSTSYQCLQPCPRWDRSVCQVTFYRPWMCVCVWGGGGWYPWPPPPPPTTTTHHPLMEVLSLLLEFNKLMSHYI